MMTLVPDSYRKTRLLMQLKEVHRRQRLLRKVEHLLAMRLIAVRRRS